MQTKRKGTNRFEMPLDEIKSVGEGSESPSKLTDKQFEFTEDFMDF